MISIVNNPKRTIIVPNATIENCVEIVNRIISQGAYKCTKVDNTLANANIWVLYNDQKCGGVNFGVKSTISFNQTENGLEMTVECGKTFDAISDQWELNDCQNYIEEAIRIAVNPNINHSEEQEIKMGAIHYIAIGLCVVAFILWIVSKTL